MTTPAPARGGHHAPARTIETQGTFEDVVTTASPATRELAYCVRDLIVLVLPSVVEVPWPSQRVAGYGVGPKKMS